MADQANFSLLTSEWGALNSHLIARFYEVVKTDNGGWTRIGADAFEVQAPLTEASMEVTLNWQSPFENAGPESKAPTLLAMLQSGSMTGLAGTVLEEIGAKTAKMTATEKLAAFEGRTGITRLNSTQVFNGMPPVKIQVTALFRAWKDPVSEVEAPFNKLMEWALPVEISKDESMIARLLKNGAKDPLSSVLPSMSPIKVGMTYKNRSYFPMVIESIGYPINSPITSKGRYTELLVPMTLCSLTAFDRSDWSENKQPL